MKRALTITTLGILISSLFLTSCNKDDFGEQIISKPGYVPGPGTFILHEGNYGTGNASLSFRNNISGGLFHEVFRHANGRPLGDVAVSMSIINDTGIVVVNNSGTLEFVRLSNMKSLGTVTGLPSPRHCVHHGPNTYVSDLMTGEIHIINRRNIQKTGSIETGYSTESMVIKDSLLFASSWSSYYINKPNNVVLVINLNTHMVVDTITVTKEPNSMVLDKEGKIWVLSSGGFMFEEAPTLACIDPGARAVTRTLVFNQGMDYPTSLRINGEGDRLVFLNMGVWALGITDNELPASSLFAGGAYLYGLGLDPSSNRIYTGDAKGFQQAGTVFILNMQGSVLDTLKAGIAPSFFCFRTP